MLLAAIQFGGDDAINIGICGVAVASGQRWPVYVLRHGYGWLRVPSAVVPPGG